MKYFFFIMLLYQWAIDVFLPFFCFSSGVCAKEKKYVLTTISSFSQQPNSISLLGWNRCHESQNSPYPFLWPLLFCADLICIIERINVVCTVPSLWLFLFSMFALYSLHITLFLKDIAEKFDLRHLGFRFQCWSVICKSRMFIVKDINIFAIGNWEWGFSKSISDRRPNVAKNKRLCLI